MNPENSPESRGRLKTLPDPTSWPADRVEKRDLEDLIPYARNARTHTPEQIDQIAASMREWGWTCPILVDEQNTVIAGHARIEAARKLGWAEVPVVVARGWTEAQKKAYVLADNKLAENAGWDREKLVCELEELRALAFDVSLTGFGADELSRLLRSGGLTDPDEVPAVEEAITVPGDVWILGKHRVVCGDATLADVVERCLGGLRPHLMVTDPPYGVECDPSWREKTLGNPVLGRGKVRNDDRADWREAWALFPGSVAYVWHSSLHCAEVAESLEAVRLRLRAQIVWVKQRKVISRGHYHWQHEAALYTVREGEDDHWRFVPEHEIAYYAVKTGETAAWNGDRKQSTVWFIEHVASDTGHGTQKPVECMKRPMENNSKAGDAVYDPFLGSGTSLIAAEITGRRCLGIELDPHYVDVAVLRWQNFTGKEAILEDSGRSFDAERQARSHIA